MEIGFKTSFIQVTLIPMPEDKNRRQMLQINVVGRGRKYQQTCTIDPSDDEPLFDMYFETLRDVFKDQIRKDRREGNLKLVK